MLFLRVKILSRYHLEDRFQDVSSYCIRFAHLQLEVLDAVHARGADLQRMCCLPALF